MTYDGNGNLTFDGVNTYTFDEENRLKTAAGSGSTAGYLYDAFNRRVSKTVNGVVTNFVFDGHEVSADYAGGGTLLAEYVYGDNLDEVLTMQKGGATYYYQTDGLGSVTEILNSSGGIAERYEYDPFGKVTVYSAGNAIVPQSVIGNRYLFTGRELDEETGTYHYRARI